jgi:exonuclease SbcC
MYQLQNLKIKNIISFKEAEFTFRNGKAMIIVGRNLDDSSQQGNGSGKSALIESIALAFTGSSIRDVKTKELIYNDEESGEVELKLLDNNTGNIFCIWRKVYSNTKSAEYKACINGIEQSDRYSDSNMFNAYVWQTIGISKEDFFSFYLITKENYEPFLLVGDTKKKEIINRFSGADKVDKAFPVIQDDCEAVQAKINTEERCLVANRAKQEVIAEQLLEEENKVSSEAKNAVITEKEKEIAFERENTSIYIDAVNELEEYCSNAQVNLHKYDIESILKPYKEAITEAQTEYDSFTFTKDYEKLISFNESEKLTVEKIINEKKTELSKVKDKFKPEIDRIKAEEDELNTSLAEAENDLRGYEIFESEVQKQLMDAITCPKCSHKFSLRNKTFDFATVKASAIDVQSTIQDYKELVKEIKGNINVDIQAKKEAVNEKIIGEGSTIKSSIETHNQHLLDISSKVFKLKKEWQDEENNRQIINSKINTCKRELKTKEQECNHQLQMLKSTADNCATNVKRKKAELASHLQNIQLLEKQLEQFKSTEADKTKLTTLEKQLSELITAEGKITDKLEILRKELEEITKWELHFKAFKSHLANQSIKNISDYTNLYLNSMGSNLSINIEGYKTLASKKVKEQISTSVLRDGFNVGSYGKFSGGERGRIDIASILAIQELIQLNANGKGIDLLIADEILESVDTLGMESIINSLQPIGKTVMLVSQQTEISTLSEYTLIIQKKNKISTIIN